MRRDFWLVFVAWLTVKLYTGETLVLEKSPSVSICSATWALDEVLIWHKALSHCCVFPNSPSLFSDGKVSQDVSSRCQVMTMSAHTNPFLCLRTFLDKSVSTSRYVERERTFDWFSLLDFTVKRYIAKHPSTGKITISVLEKSCSLRNDAKQWRNPQTHNQ